MRGLGRMVLAVLLVLQLTASAQQSVWQKVDANGKVLIDLSKERGLQSVSETSGLIVLRYGKTVPRVLRLLTQDGTPIPGKFKSVESRFDTIVATKMDGDVLAFNTLGKEIPEPFSIAGLRVVNVLGGGLVLAKSGEQHGIYDRDARRCFEVPQKDIAQLRGVRRLDSGWTILRYKLKGRSDPYCLIPPDGEPLPDAYAKYRMEGALLVAERGNPGIYCFNAQGTNVLAEFWKKNSFSASYIGEGLVHTTETGKQGVFRLSDFERVPRFDRFCKVPKFPKFHHGVCVVRDPLTQKLGALDAKGAVAIPFVYDALEAFKKVPARGNLNGKTFYLNTKNERVASPNGKPPATLPARTDIEYRAPGLPWVKVTRWEPPMRPDLPYMVYIGSGNDPVMSKKTKQSFKLSRVRYKAGSRLIAVQIGAHAGVIELWGRTVLDPYAAGWTESWIDEDGTVLASNGTGKFWAVQGQAKLVKGLQQSFPDLKIWRYLGGGYVLGSQGGARFILSGDGKKRIELPEGTRIGRCSKEGLWPVRSVETGKWGAINRTGRLAIEHKFDTLMATQNGRLRATSNGRSFFVNGIGKRQGRDSPTPGEDAPLSDGTRCLNDYADEADQRFVLTTQGRRRGREYEAMRSEIGAALVAVDVCGALGLIDRAGRAIVPLSEDSLVADVRVDGHAFVVSKAGKLRLFDKQGSVVPTADMNVRTYLGEGFVHAWKDGAHVVAALDGTVRFTLAGHPESATHIVGKFTKGRCEVRSSGAKGAWGAIDSSGKLVVPYGNAAVGTKSRSDGREVVTSAKTSKGERVEVLKKGDRFQLFRSGHKLVKSPKGSWTTSFDEVFIMDGFDYAAVRVGRNAGVLGLFGGWWLDPQDAKMKEAWIDQEGIAIASDRAGHMLFRDKDGKDIAQALRKKYPGVRIHRYLGRGNIHASLPKDKGKQHYVFPPDLKFRTNVFAAFSLGSFGIGRVANNDLCPVWMEKTRRWGAFHVNRGKPIKFMYETLMTTLDGRLLATLNGEHFYLNAKGERVGSPPAPDPSGAPGVMTCLNPYSHRYDRRWVLMRDGKPISREYDAVQTKPGASMFKVSVGRASTIIDAHGREYVPLKVGYPTMWVHPDGHAWVIDANRRLYLYRPGTKNLAAKLRLYVKWYLGEGLVHAFRGTDHVVAALDGRIVFVAGTPPKNDSVMGWSFSEGLLSVRGRTGRRKWGAIDKAGKLVVPYRYDGRFSFSDGKAVVKLNGRANAIFLKDFAKPAKPVEPKLAEPKLAEKKPGPLKAAVRCVNPKATSRDRVYVLHYGKHRSQGYNSIRMDRANQLAVVKSAGAIGLIDFTGKELIPLTRRYTDLIVGDPLITAEMTCRTNCRDRRKTYGFIDRAGNVKLSFRYSKHRNFQNGQAWVLREIRNPDLEMFRHPPEWFTDNRTAFRSGKGNGFCIQSVKTPGKYAQVIGGHFKDGKLVDGYADIEDPRFGRVCGIFKDGRLAKAQAYYTVDGRDIHVQLNAAWQPHGRGHSYRRDGSLEFVGEWRNGQWWTGTGYIKGKPNHRVDWKDGRNFGLRRAGQGVRRKPSAKQRPKPGTRTMSCGHCGGRGVVYLQATYVEVKDTSLILAGSRYYGTRYTHFEHESTRRVQTGAGGYAPCGTCKGTRFVRY